LPYLVDTDWLIDVLRGRASTVAALLEMAPEGLAVSIISVGELYDGAFVGTDSERRVAEIRTLIHDLVVLTPDDETMLHFGSIRSMLRRAGTPIGDMDLIIAATALRHGLTLATRNARHFTRVPGLEIRQR
jgi:predicted nucleic acid-binding protein